MRMDEIEKQITKHDSLFADILRDATYVFSDETKHGNGSTGVKTLSADFSDDDHAENFKNSVDKKLINRGYKLISVEDTFDKHTYEHTSGDVIEVEDFGNYTINVYYWPAYNDIKRLKKNSKVDEATIPKKLVHDVKTHPAYDPNYENPTGENLFAKFNKMLKEQGWKKVGEGYFSIVYANDKKNYILKVNTQPDPAYDVFVKFCQKQHSVYLPKIIDRKFFIKPNTCFIGPERNTYYLYFIERLQKAPKKLSYPIMNFAGALENDDKVSADHYRKTIAKYPGLSDIIEKIILKAGNNTDLLGMDLNNYNNIMMRKDGTPVIIDPYS
jgi:hypothetical protein